MGGVSLARELHGERSRTGEGTTLVPCFPDAHASVPGAGTLCEPPIHQDLGEKISRATIGKMALTRNASMLLRALRVSCCFLLT